MTDSNPYREGATLWTLRDVLTTERPQWLIDGFIHEKEVGFFWGPSNCGKTFVALDWALSVAAGVPWLGVYDVIQGPVVYCCGEGAPSLQKRIDAWLAKHNRYDVPGAYFITQALPLRDDEALEAIRSSITNYFEEEFPEPGIFPRLIIVDTLSQYFGSGDEVGPEMRDFVQNLRALAQHQSCAVLMVHHANAGGERERGHTALRCNTDVGFQIMGKEKNGILDSIEMTNDKMRDAVKTGSLRLRVECLKESLTISLGKTGNVSHQKRLDALNQLTDSLKKTLMAFETFEDEKTEKSRHSEIREALVMSRPTLHRSVDKLRKLKLIAAAGQGFSKLTLEGREVIQLCLKLPNETNETNSQCLTSTPSL